MANYEVQDVWMALTLAFKNFVYASLTILVLSLFGLAFLLPLLVIVPVQSVFIYLANRRYSINNSEGTFTFPRSDIENSISDIVLVAPYWNLLRTKTVPLVDIENLYLDTKRFTTNKLFVPNNKDGSRSKRAGAGKKKHVRYTLNVTGSFGSANLQFLDRQKRDELRNALSQSVKQATGRNVDRKVAEFS